MKMCGWPGVHCCARILQIKKAEIYWSLSLSSKSYTLLILLLNIGIIQKNEFLASVKALGTHLIIHLLNYRIIRTIQADTVKGEQNINQQDLLKCHPVLKCIPCC